MTDITIPPEAVEVALEAFAHASGLGILPDDEHDEEWRTDLVNGMTAAILAALKAWPDMAKDGDLVPGENGPPLHVVNAIILPASRPHRAA